MCCTQLQLQLPSHPLFVNKRQYSQIKQQCQRPPSTRSLLCSCVFAAPGYNPQVYLEALSELQDRLPSFPNEIAWAVMEEELGCPPAEVYEQLSEQPVAGGWLVGA